MQAKDGLKYYPKCGEVKSVTEFHKSKYNKGGLSCRCKKCRIEDTMLYNRKNSAKRKRYQKVYNDSHRIIYRSRGLLKRYGITKELFDSMLRQQCGQCAICGDRFNGSKDTCVDHDHKTGKVRQLLCSKCNNGLGCFNDNPNLLIKASEYLIK